MGETGAQKHGEEFVPKELLAALAQTGAAKMGNAPIAELLLHVPLSAPPAGSRLELGLGAAVDGAAVERALLLALQSREAVSLGECELRAWRRMWRVAHTNPMAVARAEALLRLG